jgi:hypothetical protein
VSYVDALARESASEKCVRCAKLPDWKTAALIYVGSRLDYYYCYQCRRWFVRDAKYRYATANLDEPDVVRKLLAILKLQREMAETQLETIHWFRRRLSDVRRLFWRLVKWRSSRRL